MEDAMRERVRRVFMEMADVRPEEQAAALRAACGDDERLLGEVRALLEAQARAGDFMGSPTGEQAH